MRSALFVLAVLLAPPALSQTFSGRVVGVQDGDTLTVLDQHAQRRVRLADIDAPELRQAFGTRSKESLSDLCFGKEATVQVID